MTVTMLVIILISLLLVKHFLWDFFYQPAYMWKNKGTFGHFGGILHSGVHAVSSFLILYQFCPEGALILSIGEFVIHYITDYAKMNLNKKMGWACNNSDQFWQLTGLDQLVHQLTYIGMVYVVLQW